MDEETEGATDAGFRWRLAPASRICSRRSAATTSFGAMATLCERWSRHIGEGLGHARRAVGAAEPAAQPLKIEIDHRRGVQG